MKKTEFHLEPFSQLPTLPPQVSTPNKGYTVLSTLKFAGQERIGGGQLMPTDRGRYTCQFGNEVAKTDTTMLLRIEHSPVVVHHHNR